VPLSPVVKHAEKHPNRVVLSICALLLLNTSVGAIAYYKTNQNTQQLKEQSLQFAHAECVTSNNARKAVYDLLDFAEQRIKTIQNPHQSVAQKEAALKFYEDAKKRITFIPCPPPLP
jgi:hypothetical protein